MADELEAQTAPRPLGRFCPQCGTGIRPGDGGVGAFGKVFCSEECADEEEGQR